MARKLIAEDSRFGGRGRPSFLVTTELFSRFGLSSLGDLPPEESLTYPPRAMPPSPSSRKPRGRSSRNSAHARAWGLSS